MADQNISTQSTLNQVFFRLNDLADNLTAHANASLSDAHGINFLEPVNFTDKYGNLITAYVDSDTNNVGSLVVTFSYGGIRYYSPAKLTTLPGSTPMSGLPASVLAFLAATTGAATSNWVTEFTVALSTFVSNMNTGYLLPHSHRGYWEAHKDITAYSPRAWLDSAGHTVGDAAIRMAVGGVVYEIPAKLSMSGGVIYRRGFELAADLQTASFSTMLWNKNVYRRSRDGDQYGFFYFTERNASGTLPRAVRLLLNASRFGTDPNWLVLPPGNDGTTFTFINTLFPGFWTDPQVTSLRIRSYNDLTAVSGGTSGVVNTSYQFQFWDSSGNDSVHAVAVVRIMCIAYPAGSATEKKHSFGNLCAFRDNDTDGSWIFGGPDSSVGLSSEIPTFVPSYTNNQFVTSYTIGTVNLDEIAQANLIWHGSDPLAP